MHYLLRGLGIFTHLNLPRHVEEIRNQMRELARGLGEGRLAEIWAESSGGAPLPEWLQTDDPHWPIPQELIYAVRDFMIADNWPAARRIVEKHRALMLTDLADEVFARMLRQYAGQAGPTRQIDKYRALLQRCRQIGIEDAFHEIEQPATSNEANRALRLRQSLDAYQEALERLRDIPLVYASVQLNRASTLRELAALPEQDRMGCLSAALAAYDAALERQQGIAPQDYAQTQSLRAETLHLDQRIAGPGPHPVVAGHAAGLRRRAGASAQHAQRLRPHAAPPRQHPARAGRVAGPEHGRAHVAGPGRPTTKRWNACTGNRWTMPAPRATGPACCTRWPGCPARTFNRRHVGALTAYDEALDVSARRRFAGIRPAPRANAWPCCAIWLGCPARTAPRGFTRRWPPATRGCASRTSRRWSLGIPS
ncbi:MAG: hypothetical protein HC915_19995 [Anaerolineae bacterium]|nr:hypothetical protein [Anaerolineae bacterium]